MTGHSPSQDQDLRTALDELGASHIHQSMGNGFEVVGWKIDSVDGFKGLAFMQRVDAALTAPPRPDHAGGVSLDDRMKADGMYTVAEMLGVTPLTKWQTQAGMTSVAFFEQWLDRRAAEFVRMKAGYDLGDKPKDDELYEWVLAHSAAFCEARTNLKAALAAQAPDKAAEREGLDPVSRLKSLYVAGQTLINRWSDAPELPEEIETALAAFERVWLTEMAARNGVAPKPNGTEAGRGVGAEAVEAASAAFYDSMIGPEREFFPHHTGWAGKNDAFKDRVRGRMKLALEAAATPTPPTPDSTAQGDGTSQEGTR